MDALHHLFLPSTHHPPSLPYSPPLGPPITQVDALLEEKGIRLVGVDAADAVMIQHLGLTLFPLDEEQVDPAHPLQVMAALGPTEESESEESSSSKDEE